SERPDIVLREESRAGELEVRRDDRLVERQGLLIERCGARQIAACERNVPKVEPGERVGRIERGRPREGVDSARGVAASGHGNSEVHPREWYKGIGRNAPAIRRKRRRDIAAIALGIREVE